MTPDRLTGFATTDPKDPYRLDANGMPYDVPQEAALNFIKDNKEEPFLSLLCDLVGACADRDAQRGAY